MEYDATGLAHSLHMTGRQGLPAALQRITLSTAVALPKPTIATGGYEDYYGLGSAPFTLTPDDRFLFEGEAFSSVLDELVRSIRRREPLVVVTGEIGAGKTTLCRALAGRLPPQVRLSAPTNPLATTEAFFRQLLRDWHVSDAGPSPAKNSPPHDLLGSLRQFLTSLVPERAHAVILVDEAQDLGPDMLEGIRLIADLNTRDSTLLQLVLCGRRTLDMLLGRVDMRQFSRRISKRLDLRPLSRDEVQPYIERRLWVAHGGRDRCLAGAELSEAGREPPKAGGGFWQVRFTPAAIRAVARLSEGVPLLVNVFCDRALQVGQEQRKHLIDTAMVLTAARRLQVHVPAALRIGQATKYLKIAAALAGLAAATVWGLSELSARSAGSDGAALAAREPDAAPAPSMLEVVGPLEETDGFLVAVAFFQSNSSASAMAQDIVNLGLPAFARGRQGGWQVLVGPYVTRDEAEGAQQRLAAARLTGSEIVSSVTLGPARE